MNYSEKGIENKQKYIKSTSRRLVSKTRITLFRFCIVFIVFIAIVGSFSALGYVQGLIDSSPSITGIDVIPTGFTTTIYDSEGNEIEQLIGAQSNRVYKKLNEIPKHLQQAFIAIEDKRFYQHDGIDVHGIFRAFFTGLSKGRFNQGASTLTQQLLKNQVFDGGRESIAAERLERKIQEQFLAIQLENELDKDTILEYYLNTINLGSGTFGVQTASKRYFNKDVHELTLSESAVIAAITQRPVYLNPITYPDDNAVRRAEILREMLDQGYCTQEEYDLAVADDVYTRIQSVNEVIIDQSSYYSYYVDELIEQVLEDLQTQLGYTQAQASNLLYSGGLSIYTAQNPVIQAICNEIFSDEDYFPPMGQSYWELTYALSIQKNDEDKTTIHYHGSDLLAFYKDFDDPEGYYVDNNGSKFSLLYTNKDDMEEKIAAFKDAMVEDGDTILGENITQTIQPQSSFVVMDQYTGYVSAIIGGRGVKSGNRTLNRATNTVRQPGSTFKVLSTYLPALDSSNMTLTSIQDDSGPYYYPGTEREVNNWTSKKKYKGLTTMRDPIYDSMNIVTVKTLNLVTPQVAYEYLLRLGFSSIVQSRTDSNGNTLSDINLPMALGGLTDGVSNLELTAAYASIANGGIYIKPVFYTKVLDQNKKVILDNTQEKNQIMKESTAYLLTSAMEDVVTKGTGTKTQLGINMPVAGKTGSTSDYKDLWFAGYSPYYTASIWSGFDNPMSQENRSYQQIIWRTIMERIHTELALETKSFTKPDSIVTARICTQSGKLAVDGLCDHYEGGSTVKTEYFAKGTEPTEKCDVHVKAIICTESKLLATDNCPTHLHKEVVLLNKVEEGVTDDTPYVLPTGLNANCNIHTGSTKAGQYTPQNSIPSVNGQGSTRRSAASQTPSNIGRNE